MGTAGTPGRALAQQLPRVASEGTCATIAAPPRARAQPSRRLDSQVASSRLGSKQLLSRGEGTLVLWPRPASAWRATRTCWWCIDELQMRTSLLANPTLTRACPWRGLTTIGKDCVRMNSSEIGVVSLLQELRV